MIIVDSIPALREALAPHRGGSIGFAPTMGALHAGHLSLFRAAADANDVAVASIFVNPTQFAPNEDLDAYPRDTPGDTAKARDAGIDILWMPTVDQMYPPGAATTVSVEGLTNGLCGRSRPTHFAGVTTVVSMLFNAVRPDRAYFGEKDYQQLAIIRRMTTDLAFGIEIVGMPIVREPDGVAMSSRNAYLSADERVTARALSRALEAGRMAWASGERDADALRATIVDRLTRDGGLRVDYAEVVHPHSLVDLAGARADNDAGAVAAIAAHVGATRLIDNARLDRDTPVYVATVD